MSKAGLGANNIFPSWGILLVDWTTLLSSQEAHGKPEAAAEICCSGGRISPHLWADSSIPQISWPLLKGFSEKSSLEFSTSQTG